MITQIVKRLEIIKSSITIEEEDGEKYWDSLTEDDWTHLRIDAMVNEDEAEYERLIQLENECDERQGK